MRRGAAEQSRTGVAERGRAGAGKRGSTPPRRVLRVMLAAAAGYLRIETAEERPGPDSRVLNLVQCKTQDFSCAALEILFFGHQTGPVLLGSASWCSQPRSARYPKKEGHGRRVVSGSDHQRSGKRAREHLKRVLDRITAPSNCSDTALGQQSPEKQNSQNKTLSHE